MKPIVSASALLLILLASSARATPAAELGEAGIQYMKANQFEKAADKFTEVLAQHNPYSTGLAYLYRGCCYYKMDSIGLAASDADSALEVVSEPATQYTSVVGLSTDLLKASALLAKGNYEDAKPYILSAVTIPGAGSTYFLTYFQWVDKVLLGAAGGQHTTLGVLYRDLGKSSFELAYNLLLGMGWARG